MCASHVLLSFETFFGLGYVVFVSKEDNTMSNFLTDLAEKSGLEADQAHQGVGSLLALLKDRLDPAAFAHLKNAIPNCDDLLSAIQTKMQSTSGGVLDAVKSMAGKLFAGADQGTATAVDPDSESSGLTPEHVKSLLPSLHEMLASKLPPEVINQIREHVPGFGPASD
jgi:hypothetical protein